MLIPDNPRMLGTQVLLGFRVSGNNWGGFSGFRMESKTDISKVSRHIKNRYGCIGQW